MDCSRFDDRTKSLCVVNVILLLKAFCNQPGFKPLYCAIILVFDVINSLVADYIVMRWTRTEGPGSVVQECLKFFCHGLNPLRIRSCLSIT
jgi:hypothetical protein